LHARFRFVHAEGAELGYYYEKDLVDKLGFVPGSYDKSEKFLQIGQTVQLGERKLKVEEITIKLHEETTDNFDYGYNAYGVGEQLPYNLDIIVTCK
jgi:hypothetical protein